MKSVHVIPILAIAAVTILSGCQCFGLRPSYSVTYDGNGNTTGEAPVDETCYDAGATVTVLDAGTLQRAGQVFMSWNTSAEGTGDDYAAGSSFVIGQADVTLYAQWVVAYSVLYDGNGHTGGSPPTDDSAYPVGSSVTVMDAGALERTGHTFAYWNTQADGGGDLLVPESTFTMGASDTTLFAQWVLSGSADIGFGTDGEVITDFNVGSEDTGNGMALQADGKIVVAGTSASDFAVARYNSDGSLDTSFDVDGKVTTDIGTSSSDSGYAVAIQDDGKIVVAGTSGSDFAVVRYDSDGSLDSAFGSAGKVITDFGTSSSIGETAVGIQADGKIVVAGAYGTEMAVARYTSSGTLDTTFDGDGMMTTALVGQGEYTRDLAIQSDGKIVVGGTARTSGATFDVFVARINSNGALDTTFDSDGWLTTDFGTGSNSGSGLAIQSDGKIVLVGTSSDQWAMARYNTNGSLDTTFDGDGIVLTPIGIVDSAYAVAVQSDGKLVVSGSVSFGFGGNFGIARYNPDGSLDTSFNTSGYLTANIGTSATDDRPTAVAIQPDGRIVAAGIGDDEDFGLARYWP